MQRAVALAGTLGIPQGTGERRRETTDLLSKEEKQEIAQIFQYGLPLSACDMQSAYGAPVHSKSQRLIVSDLHEYQLWLALK